MAQDILGTSPEIDLRKRWALMQLQNASSGTPTTGIGALARALQGAIGGYAGYQADQEDRAAGANLFGGGAGSLPGLGAPQPTPSAPTSPQSSPTPTDIPMSSAPRGIRNNNPGNIEDGPFARKIPGYAGSDGRFAKFDSPQGGQTAIDSLLASYGARGINNVSGVINRWAPPSDNNPTSAYAGFVAKGMGIDPNAPIDLSDPATRQKIGALIGQFENGQKPTQVASLGVGMPASPQMPSAGPQMAQNGQGVIPPVSNRASVQIPPDVAASIQRLGADPRTRPQAMQLYLQYAKPIEKFTQGVDPATGVPFQQNTVTGKKEADPTREPAIAEVQYARQNWKQLGFPDPQSAEPKDRNFWKEYNAKRLGGAGVNVSIDQSAPNEFEKKYGEGMGSRALQVVDSGDKSVEALQQINLTRSMMQAVQTGKLAPAQATIGAWAQAVGIKPETLGLDPNLPLVSQAAQSLIAKQVIGMIGTGAGGGGFPANNFSDADRKFLSSIPGSIGNVNGANDVLAEVAARAHQRNIERADAWAEARSSGLSYEKFEREWRNKVKGIDMFADIREQVKNMQGGQLPGRGATQSAPTTTPDPAALEEAKRRGLIK